MKQFQKKNPKKSLIEFGQYDNMIVIILKNLCLWSKGELWFIHQTSNWLDKIHHEMCYATEIVNLMKCMAWQI